MLLLMTKYIMIVIRMRVRAFQRGRRDRILLRHIAPLLMNKEQRCLTDNSDTESVGKTGTAAEHATTDRMPP